MSDFTPETDDAPGVLTGCAHKLHEQDFNVFPLDHPNHPKCIGAHAKTPCDGQRGKHPTVAWKTWAVTVTDKQIDRAWSKRHGIANIGIACGPSNLVVLDEDQHGELERWCVTYGVSLPDTYTVTTGRGKHYYFRWDHSIKRIGNSNNVRAKGFKIDVRGDGGYVVAAGSQHENGTAYIDNGHLVANLPTVVAEFLTESTISTTQSEPINAEDDDHINGKIAFGDRHYRLVAYASRLRKSGLDYAEAEPSFHERWLNCEQPEGQIPESRYHSAECPYPVTWDEAKVKLKDVFERYRRGSGCSTAADQDTGGVDEFVVRLVPANDIVSDIPDWAWEYDGFGRIQIGVLTLFGGRPGAGKSTGARWFAAQLSRGKLDGRWKRKPQKVAYIASEESLEQVVKPGLQLAGADMSNIVFPTVTFNGEAVALMSDRDEAKLTKELMSHGITAIFVDPIMATIRRKVDIYRNNELRDALQPWVRIAQRLRGVVVGIVHLTKGNNSDIVAAVNGSSAFGEVARCVFGFVKDPQNDGERVMSQVKNACGVEDLSLTYEIDAKTFTADSGRVGVMPVFSITGDSDTSAGEILATAGSTKLRPSMQQVCDLVKSRIETSAEAVIEAGLAKSKNSATKMLERLYKRGYIDRPQWGSYCPKVPK
jgi:hypothetical protein